MEQGLLVGYATHDITPEVGEELSGYIHREPSCTGVLDPLTLSAVVFRGGPNAAAVISADLLAIDQTGVDAIRAAVTSSSGIPAEAVAFHSIHTHASPALADLRGIGCASDGYRGMVTQKAAEAVAEALSGLEPASLSVATGRVGGGISHNRRRADGPLDDEGRLVIIERAGGHAVVICNWQCHPVCLGSGNTLVSADYVGAAREAMRRSLHPSCGVVYLNGCCGDVNPVHHGATGVRITGEGLAEATASFGEPEPASPQPVRAALLHATFPLRRDLTPEHARSEIGLHASRLAETTDPLVRRECRAMLEWAEELLAAIEGDALPEDPIADVQVIRVGDVAFCFLPCETLNETGTLIKSRSPLRHALPVSCSNGVIGYVGPRYEFEIGGYELDVASRYYDLLPFSPEAGDVLLDTALQALRRVAA